MLLSNRNCTPKMVKAHGNTDRSWVAWFARTRPAAITIDSARLPITRDCLCLEFKRTPGRFEFSVATKKPS
jgi:hypothetical protein